MAGIFLKIINMSISASWIVLAVLLLRFLLKKAPKWINVLLWGIVAVRLVCPFSFESVMSLLPSAETISPEIMMDKIPEISTGIPIINNTIDPVISGSFSSEPAAGANPFQIWIPILAIVWVIGIVILLAYTAISYWRVCRKNGTAVLLGENIYQSETVITPFVLGIIQPKIYLPFNMSEQDMGYVIAHEQAHIRRKDHLWKPLGFLLLTLHWFNPLIWLGYILLCRDIELACDEKVIKEFTIDQKADYSQALLTCSVNHRMIAACPLAFGGVGVKDRVKSVLNYKKPAFWLIIVALLASVVVSVCFLTDPIASNKNDLLLNILNNEKTFIDETGKSIYLKDYKNFKSAATVPEKYVLVDFDNDGTDEMVAYVSPNYGAYIVFHIYNNKVYGFEFGEWDLMSLKEDGTFIQRTDAGVNYVALKFENTTYRIIEQAYTDDIGNEFRINGVSTTMDRVTDFVAEFKNKIGVSWKEYKEYDYDKSLNYKSLYMQFLSGKKNAVDNGEEKSVNAYIYADNRDSDYRYTFYDMNKDGIPELCIDGMPEMYFLTIKNGELYHWYTEYSVYCKLLNNGAILYERHGAPPTHISYEYYELDETASVKFSITFSCWDEITIGEEVYPEFYEINGKEVSKKEYEEKTKKYLAIGTDKIVWYDKEEITQ